MLVIVCGEGGRRVNWLEFSKVFNVIYRMNYTFVRIVFVIVNYKAFLFYKTLYFIIKYKIVKLLSWLLETQGLDEQQCDIGQIIQPLF